MLLLDNGDLTIIDPTKSTHFSDRVLFTLNESGLIAELSPVLPNFAVIPSGRERSSAELKMTYVGVTASCVK